MQINIREYMYIQGIFLSQLAHKKNFLIINVGRIATKTKWPPDWMYYASNANMYISAKVYPFALMRASLWSTTDGKAS